MSHKTARFMITGLPRAGKTTLLHLLTPNREEEPEGGRLEVNPTLHVEFVTTPARPDDWREVIGSCIGGVWVMDGEQPYHYATIWPAIKQMQHYRDIPFIVAVNRQNDPDTLDQIRAHFPPDSRIKIFPLGEDSSSAHNVLITLIYQMLG